MPLPQHLVFDVNETLLDLSPLDGVFETIFGDARCRALWFARRLHWSTVTTLTGQFKDFGALAGDCLDNLAADQGIALGADHRQWVFDSIATLAPHRDVRPTLERLKQHGYALTALTNSSQQTVDTQFANAGLTLLFDQVLSVAAARCYKPHPDAYAVATRAPEEPLIESSRIGFKSPKTSIQGAWCRIRANSNKKARIQPRNAVAASLGPTLAQRETGALRASVRTRRSARPRRVATGCDRDDSIRGSSTNPQPIYA